MKTYVNESLMDSHNAQMRLEQLEKVRFQRASSLEIYSRFIAITALGIFLIMFGFGLMYWLMQPTPAPVAAQHFHTYEAESYVSETSGPAADEPRSISESLTEIQSGIVEETASPVDSSDDPAADENPLDAGTARNEAVLPGDQFVVFRNHILDEGEVKVVTGLTYQSDNLSQPSLQYCYRTEKRASGTMRYEVGDYTPENGFVWYNAEQTPNYQKYCQFLNA